MKLLLCQLAFNASNIWSYQQTLERTAAENTQDVGRNPAEKYRQRAMHSYSDALIFIFDNFLKNHQFFAKWIARCRTHR
jgi:hypothetical protein